MSESNDQQYQIAEGLSEEVNEPEDSNESQSAGWFDSVRGAALVGKSSFPDQIDYYDPEEDEIV